MGRSYNRFSLDEPPVPGWRLAILLIDPQEPPPGDHDPIAIGIADGLSIEANEPAPPLELLQSVVRPDPWLAVVDSTPTPLPSGESLDVAVRFLSAFKRIDEVVVFGAGEDAGPADQWWAPEMSAAIGGYPPAGSVMNALLRAASGGQTKQGLDLTNNAQLRGLVAWSLRVGRRPDWTPFSRFSWEVVGPNSRCSITCDKGVIVAARAGEVSGQAALGPFFEASQGQLWWHTEPLDDDTFALSYAGAVRR